MQFGGTTLKSRKISLLLTLTLIALMIFSCRDTLPPDYRKRAFFADIRYEYGGETFCAEITVGAPTQTENTQDIDMRFTSPPSLEGLCISQKNQTTSIDIGSVDIKSEIAANRFLSIARLLIHSGSMNFIERSEKNGLVFYRAEISDGYKTVTVLLDSNGIPTNISCGDINITIIRFEQR